MLCNEAKKEAAEQAKAEKAAAKLAKAAEKQAKKEAIQVNPETEELVEEESYDTMEVEGVTYIVQMDEDSGLTGLYHVETGEPVGIWDGASPAYSQPAKPRSGQVFCKIRIMSCRKPCKF